VLTVVLEGANDGAKMMGQGTAVSGVGDEAIQTVVGNGAVLHVRKGKTWFVVNLHGVPLDQATQVEQAVAKEIVGKLWGCGGTQEQKGRPAAGVTQPITSEVRTPAQNEECDRRISSPIAEFEAILDPVETTRTPK
jgi:hypothetical protein